MLSERVLHEGRNHILCDDKISGLRNWFIEVCMSVNTCRGSISRFSSEAEDYRQLLQDTVVLCVFEIKLPSANVSHLSSSKTTCRISATSCYELKSKGATLMLEKCILRPIKSLMDQ